MSMQRGFAVGLRLAVASLGMFMLASCGGGGGGGGGTSAPSSNADLSALSVSVGNPAPGFAAATTIYSLTVSSTTTSTSVTATTADSGASVSINGVATASGVASNAIPLTANAVTTIDIVITAANNSTKTYSVQITRSAIVLSSNADLSALNVSAPGTLTPFFAASTISYSLTTASTTATTTVTATTADTGASLTINGVAAMSGVASSVIPLTAGAVTPITIVVTAADSSSKTYSVQITRLPPPNANLSALSLSTGAIAPAFDAASLSYTSTLGFLASRVRVLTTTVDNTASVTVNGQPQTATGYEVPLVEGAITNIDVTVTVAGTPPQTYSLAVTRDMLATFQSKNALSTYIEASDPGIGKEFGNTVVVRGNTMFVGSRAAYALASPGISDGAVYVFGHVNGSWVQQDILRASNAQSNAYFGQSIVFDGTTLVVGAFEATDATQNCDKCGAAYVFTQDINGKWMQRDVLYASDRSANQWFGYQLALAGSTLVVGTRQGNAAYVFTNTAGVWSEQQKLAANGAFGGSVAFDGTHIVVGADLADDAANAILRCGAAYVFVFDSSTGKWIEHSVLRASDAATDAQFGYSVAVEGDTVVVGSPNTTLANLLGSVYVYKPSATPGLWTEQKLTSSKKIVGDAFGFSVALQGDTLVIGAPYENLQAAIYAGDLYISTRTNGNANWGPISNFYAYPLATYGTSGYSLSLDGDVLIVGGPWIKTYTGNIVNLQ